MTDTNLDLENKFLDEINQYLPKDIDWKKGAIEYLSNLLKTEGDGTNSFHLLKPFITGSNFHAFYEDMYKFLNILQIMDLPKGSTILDVGCGPGWISHYLSKLGYYVVGIDLSSELIDIANRRLSKDISPFPNNEFPVKFIVHDIELRKLDDTILFDAAIFESTLHHFYNPIAVLKNVSKNLKNKGIIAVLEGFAPKRSSKEYKNLLDLMKKYQTLERPYTKDQFEMLFNLTGFQHFTFLYPVSGIKELSARKEHEYSKLYVDGPDFIYIFASRNLEPIKNLVMDKSCITQEIPYKAGLVIKGFPDKLFANDSLVIHAKVKNMSSHIWQNHDYTNLFIYNFSYHWLDPDGNVVIFDGIRTPLPNSVSPGMEIDLSAQVKAPSQPGNYVIEFDLVRESITWFAQKGSKTFKINVKVVNETKIDSKLRRKQ